MAASTVLRRYEAALAFLEPIGDWRPRSELCRALACERVPKAVALGKFAEWLHGEWMREPNCLPHPMRLETRGEEVRLVATTCAWKPVRLLPRRSLSEQIHIRELFKHDARTMAEHLEREKARRRYLGEE